MDDVSRDIFDQIDTNRNGEIDIFEFRVYSLVRFGFVSSADLEEIDLLFHAMDADQTGTLTYEEVEEYYQKPGGPK